MKNSSDSCDELLKSRKIGVIFLIETFYRKALDAEERKEINDKQSMMYVSHVQKPEEPQVKQCQQKGSDNLEKLEPKKSHCSCKNLNEVKQHSKDETDNKEVLIKC